MKSYRTIQQSGENEIVIEKSRFIAHCRYVETVEEAENFIHEMKKNTMMQPIMCLHIA